MSKTQQPMTIASSYELVAMEYYDPERHPTCANFREASRIVLRRMPSLVSGHLNICEVGPGKSLLAEVLAQTNGNVASLTLVDESPSMLRYSEAWRNLGVELRVASAFVLPFTPGTFDLVVSCLGDPYNSTTFWREVYRVLRPHGKCLFTTPSWEWAKAFREDADAVSMHSSAFELADGTRVLLPSHIYSEQDQIELMRSAGLAVSVVTHVSIGDLAGQKLSPKLVLTRGTDANVVTGYVGARLKKNCQITACNF
jgi:SAM-dependent methyltransferase